MDLGKISSRMIRLAIKTIVYLAILCFVGFFCYRCFQFGQAVFSQEGLGPAPGYEQAIVIEPGMDAWDIAKLLEEQVMIADAKVFYVQSLIFQLEISDETPGTYMINDSMSGEEIVKMISLCESRENENQTEEE